MIEQKWVCNKCGFETKEKPRCNNTTCQSCGRGRYQCWKKCECGKWFQSKCENNLFCSRDCGLKFRKTGGKKGKHYPNAQRARIAICPICGNEFRAVKEYKDRKSVYCSKACWERRASLERNCLTCGKTFTTQKSANQKYCSKKCYDLSQRDRKGELSHLWQGGKTKKMICLRTSAEYRDWRMAVFKRDGFRCQNCGKRGSTLEAHHIKEKCNYPELMFDVDNGITLCHDCHKNTDNYGRKAVLL